VGPNFQSLPPTTFRGISPTCHSCPAPLALCPCQCQSTPTPTDSRPVASKSEPTMPSSPFLPFKPDCQPFPFSLCISPLRDSERTAPVSPFSPCTVDSSPSLYSSLMHRYQSLYSVRWSPWSGARCNPFASMFAFCQTLVSSHCHLRWGPMNPEMVLPGSLFRLGQLAAGSSPSGAAALPRCHYAGVCRTPHRRCAPALGFQPQGEGPWVRHSQMMLEPPPSLHLTHQLADDVCATMPSCAPMAQ
jgi:hypothetical protein